MGIEATLTVPRNEVRKKQRPTGLPRFELHKEWNELDGALEQVGAPVSLALRGNQADSQVPAMDAEIFLVPPTLVKKISKALDGLSNDKLLDAIRGERKRSAGHLRGREHQGLIATFDTLREAYRLAANTGAYLEVFIG